MNRELYDSDVTPNAPILLQLPVTLADFLREPV